MTEVEIKFVKCDDWSELKATLTRDQIDAIKAKCRWEGLTWVGVLCDWPHLYVNENNADIISKIRSYQ